MVYDATDKILGRLASQVAKEMISARKSGRQQRVIIINAEDAIVSGPRTKVLSDYRAKYNLNHARKGPFFPRMPDKIIKRTVRECSRIRRTAAEGGPEGPQSHDRDPAKPLWKNSQMDTSGGRQRTLFAIPPISTSDWARSAPTLEWMQIDGQVSELARKKRTKVVNTSGKRKIAIARATLKPGKGRVRINGHPIHILEPELARRKALEPIRIAEAMNRIDRVDISVDVKGGGQMGQVDAIRTAIARGLVKYNDGAEGDDEELRDEFVRFERKILVNDPRRKEPKHQMGRGARKKWQKSYR